MIKPPKGWIACKRQAGGELHVNVERIDYFEALPTNTRQHESAIRRGTDRRRDEPYRFRAGARRDQLLKVDAMVDGVAMSAGPLSLTG